MKNISIILFCICTSLITSCTREAYTTNGETIYRTGENVNGEKLLDKSKSKITIIKSCQGCHGESGDRMERCNIKWSHLANVQEMKVPYNDSLFSRFLDQDMKSDGTPAKTGVHWQLTQQDKKDLIVFLKTL